MTIKQILNHGRLKYMLTSYLADYLNQELDICDTPITEHDVSNGIEAFCGGADDGYKYKITIERIME